jgi:PEP-CTERM motif
MPTTKGSISRAIGPLGRVCIALVAAIAVYPKTPAFALAVPVVGWGYSIGNAVYSAVLPNQPSIKKGFGWVFDPPGGLVLSGRLTVEFDPSWTIGGVGWFGEFGADPSLPTPPIGATDIDVALLQANPNPLMQSGSIAIDPSAGTATFNFDWGPNGLPVGAEENIAGIYFSNLLDLPPNPLTILGSPLDVIQNGTNALTYMSCSATVGSARFFCGSAAIPEPSTYVLFGFGFVGLAILRPILSRRRKQGATVANYA